MQLLLHFFLSFLFVLAPNTSTRYTICNLQGSIPASISERTEKKKTMSGAVTYRLKMKTCGKPNCRKCRESGGHGPYWYAYTTIGGRTVEKYIGLHLPPEAQVSESSLGAPPAIHTRLFTLGHVHLERLRENAWQPVRDPAWLAHPDARLLLGLLVSSPERALPCEEVCASLWPEAGSEIARTRLQLAIRMLLGVIESQQRGNRRHPPTIPLLRDSQALLKLAGQAQFWVDADAFEDTLNEAYRSSDAEARELLLDKALALYGGDFWPEARLSEWSAVRREALRRAWVGLLLELADLRTARGYTHSAIEVLDRLLAADPGNEAAASRLIAILARQSRRGEALRIYQRFATALAQEADLAPSQEIQVLYEAIRKGEPVQGDILRLPSARQAAKPLHLHTAPRTSEIVHIGRTNQSPLVGRDSEQALLRACVREVETSSEPALTRTQGEAHHARFLLLLGELGLGKTRLAEEGGREALGRGWHVLWGRSYAQEGRIPYRIWSEILRDAFQQSQRANQEIAAHPSVLQVLGSLLPELHELLPGPLPLAETPEQEQLRLWEAARLLLATIAEGLPLYIVLDDLQWADSSSCALLGYLVRQLRAYPILFVGTCRESELPSNQSLSALLASLQHERAVELLSIRPLTDAQIRTLVAHVPEPVARHIQTHAAGNPFFAEELARGIRPHSTSSGQLPPLPDTISAVLDQRLSNLSPACQQLLGKASVLGGSFQFSVLSQLVAPASSEDLVLDLLEEALCAGVLTEEGAGTRITYHFWHPLLVSHLYNSLSATRRAHLHLRAASVLQQVYADHQEEEAAAITYHLTSGDGERAAIARYAELAGDYAYRLSAYPDAVRSFRQALAYRENLYTATNQRERLHLSILQERLGECLTILGEYEQARDCYLQALDERREHQKLHPPQEMEREAQVQALLWSEVGWAWRYMGEMDRAWQCCASGEQVLREAGVTVGPAWASLYYQRSSLSWQEGNYEEARSLAESALALFAAALPQAPGVSAPITSLATRIQRTLAGDPVDLGRVHTLLAAIAATVGQSVEATSSYNTALRIFEQHDRQREIASVACNLGDVYLRRAEHPQAASSLRRALAIAERIGDRATVCVVSGNLGVLARRLGNLPEAETWYRQATALAEQIADPIYVSLWHAYLAAVLHEQGKLSEAIPALRQAFTAGRSIPFCFCFSLVTLARVRISLAQLARLEQAGDEFPSMHRLAQSVEHTIRRALAQEGIEAETKTEGELVLAMACLLRKNLAQALHLVEGALAQAEHNEQKALEAWARELLGAVLLEQGQTPQAERCFAQALAIFEAAGMCLDSARVRTQQATALLQSDPAGSPEALKGMASLQEAIHTLQQCHAVMEARKAETLLKLYSQ